MSTYIYKVSILLCLALGLASCGDNAAKGKKGKRSAQLVETTTVERSPVKVQRIVTGTLEAVHKVNIFNQEEGRIIELPFHEGDRVEKGQIVARIDATLIRAELDKAIANYKQAKLNLKRLKKLIPRKLASEDELARTKTILELARAEEKLQSTRLARTQIRAPFAGVITERLKEPGDVAPVHSHILTLIDPDQLKASVHVSELLLTNMHPGTEVQIRIDALGDQPYAGKVLRTFPTIDPVTRQGVMEVSLDPVPVGALPGQLCRVKIETETAPLLRIPLATLRHDIQGAYVFKVGKKNKAKRTTVVTGAQINEWIEVIEGLEESDQIVSKGFLGLRDGMAVKTVTRSAQKPEEPAIKSN